MDICIISSNERREKDFILVKYASKFFKNVKFIEVENLILEVGKGFLVKNEDLNLNNFDVVFPIPTYLKMDLFLPLIKMIETKLPIKDVNYLKFSQLDSLSKEIKKIKVKLRERICLPANFYEVNSLNLKYPLIVEILDKKILVQDEYSLKEVLKFSKIYNKIVIKRPIKGREIWSLCFNKKILGSYMKEKNSRYLINVDKTLTQKIKNLLELFDLNFACISFIKSNSSYYLDQIIFSPNFKIWESLEKSILIRLFEEMRNWAKEEKIEFFNTFKKILGAFKL